MTDVLPLRVEEDHTEVGSDFVATYPPGKTAIAPWFAGTSAADADGKANELVLPEGRRP